MFKNKQIRTRQFYISNLQIYVNEADDKPLAVCLCFDFEKS